MNGAQFASSDSWEAVELHIGDLRSPERARRAHSEISLFVLVFRAPRFRLNGCDREAREVC